jgi:hypothetical protein
MASAGARAYDRSLRNFNEQWARLGVLKTQVFVSIRLETQILKYWSWSCTYRVLVLVLVLDCQVWNPCQDFPLADLAM